MKSRNALGKLLQNWQVKPALNPRFQTEVWKRIRRLQRRKRR